MAKRFTDTEKYKKPFFKALPGPYKLLWDYLYHDCNHAGIWQKDFQIAQIYLGPDMPIDEGMALNLFNKGERRIEVLESGEKWLILPFVEFQYGTLNPLNRLHSSVIGLLSKYKKKGLASPLEGAKDKDKDKDKDKVKEGESKERGETELQKVVKGWKMLNDIPIEGPDSQAWDQVHFSRNAKAAKSLLTLFGYEGAVNCMEYVFLHFKRIKMDCTLETVVKRSDLFREQLAGRGK